jgi:hypothetical protein
MNVDNGKSVNAGVDTGRVVAKGLRGLALLGVGALALVGSGKLPVASAVTLANTDACEDSKTTYVVFTKKTFSTPYGVAFPTVTRDCNGNVKDIAVTGIPSLAPINK